jgi:hypothetical protein
MKFSISIAVFLFTVFIGYGQDSLRTKNDKPGTPQSLRTPDNSPQSHVHILNNNVAPLQTINHGATESNQVNSTRRTIVTADTNSYNHPPNPQATAVPSNKIAPVNDSLTKGVKSNVSDPVRK